MNKEFRNYGEFRDTGGQNDALVLSGYAALYNSRANIWGWQEMILPGAFKRAVSEKQDIRFLFNHDPNLIYGRTRAGTLEAKEDETGLHFQVQMPDTQSARELHNSIKRGDISQCSFAFFNAKENIRTLDDGTVMRELIDMDVDDVSAVTYPAYPETEVIARMAEKTLSLPEKDLGSVIKKIRESEKRSLFDSKILEIGAISENNTYSFPGWKYDIELKKNELNKKIFEQEE